MATRPPRSIDLPGLSHAKTPIPLGARVGGMIFSSGISGKDPATGALPADAATQARFAFDNLRKFLQQAGATLDDVGRITVYVKDESLRTAVNEAWVQCFPDPADRPARHTLVHDLRSGMLVQLDVIAVVQGDAR